MKSPVNFDNIIFLSHNITTMSQFSVKIYIYTKEAIMNKWLIVLIMTISLIISGCGGGGGGTPSVDDNRSNSLKVNDDNVTLNEDTNKSIDVLDNDINATTILSITNPVNGTATIVANKVVYTPNANYYGADSFEYIASNGDNKNGTAKVNITVNAVNDEPIANDDSVTTQEDTNVVINVLNNDSDIDGDTLTIAEINPAPNKGTAAIVNNKIVYTPDANKNGEDSFGYKISDGNGGETTGSVIVNITAVNDAPVITGGDSTSKSVAENSTAVMTVSADDVENDPISYSISGGEDDSKFDINASSGELKFKDAPDYENPTDANGDNDYIVEVSASDGSLSDTQIVTVTVTDEDDTVSGKVADGYVANATITVYSDRNMTNIIGGGNSDDNGDFNVNITQNPIPNTVYIKSVGGVIIDTGMAAPTMYLMADTTSGSLNVTPIGTTLYDMVDSGLTQQEAEAKLKVSLGLSTTDKLYEDPIQNSDLNDAMKNKLLSGNLLSSSLADGNYTVIVAAYSKEDFINNEKIENVDAMENSLNQLVLTVTNGAIAGSIVGAPNSSVTGYVSGTTIVLTLYPQANYEIDIAGTIGQLGSCSGVMTVLNQNVGHVKGVFAAQFVPQNITATQVNATIQQMVLMASKTQDFIFRTFIGASTNIGIGSMITTNIDSGLKISITDSNTTLGDGSNMLMEFSNESRFLKATVNGSDFPTNMAVRVFNLHANTDPASQVVAKVYTVHPIGLRKALVVAVNPSDGTINSIGDSYLSAKGTTAPHLEDSTTYKLATANVHAGMINDSRANMLNQQAIDNASLETIVTGVGMDQAFRLQPTANSGQDVMFFSASVIGIYNDDNLNDFADINDSIDIVQLYQSGALDGEEVIGGNMPDGNGGVIDLKSFPGVFVGFLNKDGTTAPAINGKYNFIARSLYVDDYSMGLGVSTGEITLSENSASMEIGGNTVALNVNFTNGIYHISGPISQSEFIDIAWPSGGKKAIYAVSDKVDGTGNVIEVGEAYLSR